MNSNAELAASASDLAEVRSVASEADSEVSMATTLPTLAKPHWESWRFRGKLVDRKSSGKLASKSSSSKLGGKVGDKAKAAATKVQAAWRRTSLAVWLSILDKAAGSEKALKKVALMLQNVGPAGGQALGKLILYLSGPGTTALARARKRALIGLLRSGTKLVNFALKTVLPRFMTPTRRQVQNQLAALHNAGAGLPLGEEGPAQNYTLEILRADDAGNLWRRVEGAEGGEARYERVFFGLDALTSSVAKCLGSLRPCPFDSTPVQPRGLIKRTTCRVDTRLVKREKGVSRKAARERHLANADVDLVTDCADRYLEQIYSPPVAQALQKVIPRRAKSMLDFEYPVDFMPRAMRDDPENVLSLDLDVDIAVRFDSPEPLFNLDSTGLGDFTSVAKVQNDTRFVFFIRGHHGFPSLGTFELKNFKLEARALAWWDVFDSKIDLAFTKEDPPKVSWDIEVALGGAAMPLPDCIEDHFLGGLTSLVMRCFNRAYPLHLDIDEMNREEAELQERWGCGGLDDDTHVC
mmetsp:Transcript_42350/g.133634  ORF Transcript_42350/g.133634 Transcript_42350/m.133634 type:complete len:522 (-) Transcript_42350:168-1733(-)